MDSNIKKQDKNCAWQPAVKRSLPWTAYSLTAAQKPDALQWQRACLEQRTDKKETWRVGTAAYAHSVWQATIRR